MCPSKLTRAFLDMLIKATIAGGGVIPHIHKSLLEKQQTHVIPESTT